MIPERKRGVKRRKLTVVVVSNLILAYWGIFFFLSFLVTWIWDECVWENVLVCCSTGALTSGLIGRPITPSMTGPKWRPTSYYNIWLGLSYGNGIRLNALFIQIIYIYIADEWCIHMKRRKAQIESVFLLYKSRKQNKRGERKILCRDWWMTIIDQYTFSLFFFLFSWSAGMLPIYLAHSNPSDALHFFFKKMKKKRISCCCCLGCMLLYMYKCVCVCVYTTSIYLCMHIIYTTERMLEECYWESNIFHSVSSRAPAKVYWLVCMSVSVKTVLSVNHSDLTRYQPSSHFFFFLKKAALCNVEEGRKKEKKGRFLWPFSILLIHLWGCYCCPFINTTLWHSLVNVWIDFINICTSLSQLSHSRGVSIFVYEWAVTNRHGTPLERGEKEKKVCAARLFL